MHRARSRDRAGGGAPPAWTPARLAPELWYRSDLGVSTSGGNVTTWANQGTMGAAGDLTQGTAASRYALEANALGSIPALRSAASAKSMVTAAFAAPLSQPGTVVVVCTSSVDPLDGTRFVLADIAAGNGWELAYSKGDFFGGAAGTNAVYCFAGTDTPVIVSAGGTASPVHAFRAEYNGATSRIYRDTATTPTSNTANAGARQLTGLSIGKAPGAAATHLGDLYEVIVANRILAAAEATSLAAYLARRYAVA